MADAGPLVEDIEVMVEKPDEVKVRNPAEINGSTNGAKSETQNGTKRKFVPLVNETVNNNNNNNNNNKEDGGSDIAQSKRSKIGDEKIESTKGCSEPHDDIPNADNTEEAQSSSNNDEQSNSQDEKIEIKVKIEPRDSGCSEPHEDIPNADTEEAQSSSSNDEQSNSQDEKIEIKVKIEPGESDVAASTSTGNVIGDIKPAIKVEKADASSTSRESCKYGIRCYRRNPMHRIEEAHPGDFDYKRPYYPPPLNGVADCPYGTACYRRNPTHFEAFKHPDDTDFQQNYRNHRLRQRKKQQQQQNNSNDNDYDGSDLDDYDLDDPFINDDSDLDYVPSSDEEDYTEELDYDDCDKAED